MEFLNLDVEKLRSLAPEIDWRERTAKLGGQYFTVSGKVDGVPVRFDCGPGGAGEELFVRLVRNRIREAVETKGKETNVKSSVGRISDHISGLSGGFKHDQGLAVGGSDEVDPRPDK